MNPFELAKKLMKGEAITDDEYRLIQKHYYLLRRIFASRMYFAYVLNNTNIYTFTPEMIADYMKYVIPYVVYHYRLKKEQYLKNIFPKKKDREEKKEFYEYLTRLGYDYKTYEMAKEMSEEYKEIEKEFKKVKKELKK